MTATARLAATEWRLLRREPLVLVFGFAFPLALLVVMGSRRAARTRTSAGSA